MKISDGQYVDVVAVYRRLLAARLKGKGARLSWAEVCAVCRDDAITQAVSSADEYERDLKNDDQ